MRIYLPIFLQAPETPRDSSVPTADISPTRSKRTQTGNSESERGFAPTLWLARTAQRRGLCVLATGFVRLAVYRRITAIVRNPGQARGGGRTRPSFADAIGASIPQLTPCRRPVSKPAPWIRRSNRQIRKVGEAGFPKPSFISAREPGPRRPAGTGSTPPPRLRWRRPWSWGLAPRSASPCRWGAWARCRPR